MSNSSFKNITSFILETGLLNNFKRSGFDFLGTSNQNISSHIFRTTIISYILSKCINGANTEKAVLISLFHDVPETRTGDINYFQKKYIEKNEERAVEDIITSVPEISSLKEYILEFNSGDSIESIIARDADTLELIFTLKEEFDKGNKQAQIWINDTIKRLKLNESKNIVSELVNMNSYDWWMDIMKINR